MKEQGQLEFISIERKPERAGKTIILDEGKRRKEGTENQNRKSNRNCKRKSGKKRIFAILLLGLILVSAVKISSTEWMTEQIESVKLEINMLKQKQISRKIQNSGTEYPQELLDMLEDNAETVDFFEDYEKREEWLESGIDLSGEVQKGEVPLLLQWDRRWGYNSYGDGMIGWTGCGPTCMAMVYLYLTGDATMNPRTMAEFAEQNGYYTTGGTSWSFWTNGAERLGIHGEEISLDMSVMQAEFDDGNVIVCSMRPGDFTKGGHYIVLRGYDANGFFVNDPNSRSNSEKQWSYEQMKGQIKNLWSMSTV
jgi:hypothetical protein